MEGGRDRDLSLSLYPDATGSVKTLPWRNVTDGSDRKRGPVAGAKVQLHKHPKRVVREVHSL